MESKLLKSGTHVGYVTVDGERKPVYICYMWDATHIINTEGYWEMSKNEIVALNFDDDVSFNTPKKFKGLVTEYYGSIIKIELLDIHKESEKSIQITCSVDTELVNCDNCDINLIRYE